MTEPAGGSTPVVVIVPAKDEADRIEATIRAVRRIPGVVAVIVVDDGSADATGRIAADSGAEVVRHARNHGKADALMSGLGRLDGLKRVGRVDPGRTRQRRWLSSSPPWPHAWRT